MRYIRTEECDSYEANCWWDIIFTWSLALASSHILRQHKYVYITLRYYNLTLKWQNVFKASQFLVQTSSFSLILRYAEKKGRES